MELDVELVIQSGVGLLQDRGKIASKPRLRKPPVSKSQYKKKSLVTCAYCTGPATFHATSNHLYSRDYGPVWHCDPCKAWVGCHPDGKPLGRLADAELRSAKMVAHNMFEPLIAAKMRRDGCSKSEARNAGYAWLAQQLGIDRRICHIGMFDEAMCKRVEMVCSSYRVGSAA